MDSRWLSGGRKVIYAASSFALAFAESMYYRQGIGFNNDYRTVLIEIPDNLKVTSLKEKDLPITWRSNVRLPEIQDIGNSWYDSLISPVLSVPSAVVITDVNFIINTMHPDFQHISIAAIGNFLPDERIEKILKNYKA